MLKMRISLPPLPKSTPFSPRRRSIVLSPIENAIEDRSLVPGVAGVIGLGPEPAMLGAAGRGGGGGGVELFDALVVRTAMVRTVFGVVFVGIITGRVAGFLTFDLVVRTAVVLPTFGVVFVGTTSGIAGVLTFDLVVRTAMVVPTFGVVFAGITGGIAGFLTFNEVTLRVGRTMVLSTFVE